MSRHTLTRTLVAALAVMALAAPTALARPADPAPAPAATDSHAVSSRVQDLRRLKAGNSIRTSSLAATSKTPGYTPGETSGREAYYSPAGRAALAQERYYSSYGGTPSAVNHPARVSVSDDSAPWTTIALGLLGACLMIGAAAALAGRTRRARIAA